MRRFVLGLALLVVVLPGCGPGQECAVDTDCPFASGSYCSADGRCVPRGTGGGETGPRDAGGGETGPRDGGAGDAPRTDTPADAPMTSCPAVAGSYPLTMVGIGCTGVTAATVTLSGPPSPSDCSFEVQLDDRVTGAVAHGDRNTFMGTLSVLDPPGTCTLVFADDLRSVDVTCGACMFSAARP